MMGAALRYPLNPNEDDKQRLRVFFGLVPVYLPCANCSLNFLNELNQDPLTDEILSHGPKVVEWLNRVHNSVNRRLGKPEITMDQMHAFFYLDVRNEPRPEQRKPGLGSSPGLPGPDAKWEDFVDHTANMHKADEAAARQKAMMPAFFTMLGCIGLLLAATAAKSSKRKELN
jgi:hypothetical protein